MEYNPICAKAYDDMEKIVTAWESGKGYTSEMALNYLVNRAICKDSEMGKYWKKHNQMYHGAVYPDDSHEKHHFTNEMAEEWNAEMVNSDGTHGGHWTKEQTTAVAKQQGIDLTGDITPCMFWVTMNMFKSDYCEVAKKHGVDTVDYYVDMAKAFLIDVDSVSPSHKLYYYKKYIVK